MYSYSTPSATQLRTPHAHEPRPSFSLYFCFMGSPLSLCLSFRPLSFSRFRSKRTNQRSPKTLLHPVTRSHACQYRVGTLVRSTLILFTRLRSFFSLLPFLPDPIHSAKWILPLLFSMVNYIDRLISKNFSGSRISQLQFSNLLVPTNPENLDFK